jgi:RluA family pseudouridine synthase
MSKPNHPENVVRLSANWPELEILYQDGDLFAVNKPAGLLVGPDRWNKSAEYLMGLLFAAIRAGRPWTVSAGIRYLANAHRLDRFTTGVLLLAKNKPALVHLARQFHRQHPRKIYVALVRGTPESPEMEINFPIAPSPVQAGLSVINPKRGKPAKTQFTVLERFRNYTLLQARPATGRQHQIRIHLQAIGCPLVADADYGNGQPLLLSRLKPNYKMKAEGERPLLARPALHAEFIEIAHPATDQPISITAPWPKDLTIAVKYLRRFAGI